jgi:hypothetical protein
MPVLLVAAASLAPAASADLYWTTGGTPEAIGRAEIDGGGVDPTFIDFEEDEIEPSSVAIDSEHVYWTSFDGGAIGRASLDGSEIDPSFITLPAGSEMVGLTLDSEHLYWANSALESIGRADIDGTHIENDFIKAPKTEELDPNDVAVDKTHIYWTNTLTEGTIGRANLDGHAIAEEFITGVGLPWELDVDSEHVFWTNREVGQSAIGRADIDGTGVDPAFIPLVSEPLGIVVDGVHVFWTNGEALGRVGRATLDGGTVEEAFIPGPFNFIGSITAEVTPIVAASPASLSFGSDTPVPQNSISRPQTITYTNEGNEPLEISGFSLTGTDAGEFLTGTDTCRQTIAPGATCTMQVRFAPQAPGNASASLTALTNAPENPDTALNGIASAPVVGPPGPAGPAGPAGVAGAAGPRGPAGKNAKVTCKVKKSGAKTKVTCKVKLVKPKSSASVAWRLTRRQRTVAHGVARARNGRISLALPGVDRLPPGRYVLHLAGRRQGTSFVIRVSEPGRKRRRMAR